jgi:hypothetical protein
VAAVNNAPLGRSLVSAAGMPQAADDNAHDATRWRVPP